MTSRIVRKLEAAEVAQLVEWAAAEGWNPGKGDAVAFHAADPGGFLGAFVDGEMAAGISAVRYGTSYGFIGLYICRPQMRGMGHGKVVWQAGMAWLEGRIVGLDGVDAQFENYRSQGFAPAYRTVRFGGRFQPSRNENRMASWAVVDLKDEMLSRVIRYDRQIFPDTRGAFLQHWLAGNHIVHVAISGDVVRGYGVLRACEVGWKVGGLCADDDEIAKELFRSLAQRADGDVFIDVPQHRSGFTQFLRDSALSSGFETTRMYAGGMLSLSPLLFGVTTLELG